jgi:hypothetical protein
MANQQSLVEGMHPIISASLLTVMGDEMTP